MTSTITVSIRSVYGNETVYPACPISCGFARLAGTKTLTSDALRIIRGMGFKIEVEAPSIRIAA